MISKVKKALVTLGQCSESQVITAETKLEDDLQCDELDRLELIMELEDTHNVTIDSDGLEMTTVKDVIDVLTKAGVPA